MITASCGHKLESFEDGIEAMVSDYDKYGDSCVKCLFLCEDCYLEYMIEGRVLKKLEYGTINLIKKGGSHV